MHTTTLKENTMAPKSRLFQASFPATLLQSAALAIALLVPASPARAEVVTLVCQHETGISVTIRVDYDRNIVDLLKSDGTASFSSAAQITEGAVKWEVLVNNANGQHFFGTLNRLTGQLSNMSYPVDDVKPGFYYSRGMSGLCRRATQKF
jgi:hypothetical protein